MYIERSELQSAIAATEHAQGGKIDFSLAEVFLSALGEKKKEVEDFGEAIRLSLNDACIWDEEKRHLYASLVGFFYGRRGNAVQRADRAQRRTRERNRPIKQVRIIEDKKGQFAFEL